MTPDTISQTVLFPDLFDKPLVATFNREQASSDGGAVLLKAAERVYGLVKAFAGCLADKRAPEKIRHTLAELIGQRIFGIACGHPDGNDADHLAEDPIHKLLLGRDPVAGAPLASQPTISRFENGPGRGALYRMARELAACVIERHRRRLRRRVWRVTIDLDPTDDRTHGAQQLTFFNGHYDSWCYLPLLAFLTFNDEKEQYLCAAVLRPGKAVAADGTLSLLCRLLPMLRAAFPATRFLVRLDGGFATPEILDFLDAEAGLDYVVAVGKNAVLQRHAESAMAVARAQSEASGRTEHVYTDTRYAARTWGRERRVVIKAEVVRLKGREPRDNPRFVVTNLLESSRFVYERVYCARGDIENRIKELLDGLQIDRTSCCKFLANQLRVLLTAAAYVLMQELRLRAARTGCARTQVTWLRDRLLKLGGIRLPGAGLIFSSGNGRKWTEPSGKLLHDEVVPAQICRHRGVGLCGCEEAGNKGHEGRLAGRRTCAEHVAVESAHGRLAVPLSPRQLVGASSAATVGPAGSLAGRWVWRLRSAPRSPAAARDHAGPGDGAAAMRTRGGDRRREQRRAAWWRSRRWRRNPRVAGSGGGGTARIECGPGARRRTGSG